MTPLLSFILSVFFCSLGHCAQFETNKETCLERSDYVTIVITVPETHANAVREAMGKGGAGKVGSYSYCSYSVKGIGRFMPNKGSDPFIGKES